MIKKFVISMTFLAVAGTSLTACLPTNGQPAASPAPTATSDDEATNTISQAMMTGASLRCQIVNAERGETISYVTKDKKMHVTTTMMNDENQTQNSFMINDGQYIYIWTDGEPNGYKSQTITEEDLKDIADKAPNTSQQTVPDFSQTEIQQEYEDKGYTISCDPAQVEDSTFIPPTNVSFQDMSALMDGALEAAKRMEKPN